MADILRSLLQSVGVTLLLLIPLLIIVLVMGRRQKRYRKALIDPFTDMPLRPPGESLRLKIESLDDELDNALSVCSIAVMGAIAMILATPSEKRFGAFLVAGGCAAIACAHSAPKMFRTQKSRWHYRLGFTGERVVGEQLNQLLSEGFHVFHDLPFKDFNIDHVIVGVQGVYAVETKTRSKPADLKGLAKAKVYYDGVTLRFPNHQESEPIAQARLNAKTLSIWLSQSTGEHTPVGAVVAIPGWWVERTGRSDVNVLNPKEIIGSFPNKPASPLSSSRIQRIVYQLTERCRLAKPT